MIVVADTSPLLYLILLGHEQVLPALYGRVIAPRAVISELSHTGTPQAVRLGRKIAVLAARCQSEATDHAIWLTRAW